MAHAPHISRLPLLLLVALAASLTIGVGPAQASYSIARAGTVLQLTGDAAGDNVRIDRDAAGVIRVDVGADGTFEDASTSTVANTTRISVTAAGGDDTVQLSEAQGALPPATIDGGEGADNITSGSGADTLTGGPGDDVLITKGGSDSASGGADADTLTGGDADDIVNGDDGGDTFIWNPGDDTDAVNGGAGGDRAQVNGGNGAEVFTLDRNQGVTGVALNRLTPAPFTFDLTSVERVQLNMNGGDDSFTGANNLAGLAEVVEIDPGPGGVQPVNGTDLSDVLIAGPANPLQFDGEEGADVYRWSTGDGGGDTVNLGDGADEVSVTGADAPEQFGAEAVGPTLRVTNTTEAVTIDATGANKLSLSAAGGNDTFTPTAGVTDLVAVDASGDGGDDTLVGTDGPETLRGGDGDDTISAHGGADALFGDAGTDALAGGAGPDSFSCGGFGDTLDATAEDTVAADCLKPADPTGDGSTDPQPQTDQPDVDTGLPAGFKGFSRPRVSGRTGNLVVRFGSQASVPITVRVAGSESASRAARTFRYRAVTRTLAPGTTAKITLRAPARLSRLLRRNLARRGRIVRRPRITVTNAVTGGKTTVRPKITVRARRR